MSVMRLYVYVRVRECVARFSYGGAGDLDPMANTDEFSPWEGRVAKHSAMPAPMAMRYSIVYDDV